MDEYGKIAAEGFLVVLNPLLWAGIAILLLAILPFYILGLIKRGVVAAFTGGDPLVP